jgi:hypothetical protein
MTKTYSSPATRPFADGDAEPVLETPVDSGAPTAEPVIVGPIRRRSLDGVLIAIGAVVTVVLLAAGGLLMWGRSFANDYVSRELTAQNIVFPEEAALVEDGRTDLVQYAGEQVTTGSEAEAYASYIGGHLVAVADGATYADLGQPERAARAELQAATEDGAPQATVDELQARVDELGDQRNTLFKGETLRGLLLSTYAWSTIGTIAGIAALVCFGAALAMVVLIVLGLVHRHRTA